MLYDIIIIGGGAAGLFCALAALKKEPKTKLLILEKRKPARKLLLSGNGRCNIGNTDINNFSYNDYEFAKNVIDNACGGNYRKWLSDFGIETREIGSKMNTDSWLYPVTEQSKTVVESLLEQLRFYGACFFCGEECKEIYRISENVKENNKTKSDLKKDIENQKIKLDDIDKINGGENYEVCCASKALYRAKKIIIAAGSSASGGENSLELLEKLGIRVKPFEPSLCGFHADCDKLSNFDGQRIKAKVTLREYNKDIMSEEGEIVVKRDSINGICIMQLSRYVSKKAIDDGKARLICDFAPYFTIEELSGIFYSRLTHTVNKNAKTTFYNVDNLYMGVVPKCVFDAAKGAKRNLSRFHLDIAEAIKNYELPIKGKFSEKDCQIMSGGVDLSEIEVGSMRLKKYKGIYVVGEITDIDGACGGYNIMYAATSGCVAANDAVMKLKGKI